MRVKYLPVAHDGPHTMEQQMFLLAKSAYRVWDAWCNLPDKDRDALSAPMQLLYTQLYQTDVFMGGVHHGEDSK